MTTRKDLTFRCYTAKVKSSEELVKWLNDHGWQHVEPGDENNPDGLSGYNGPFDAVPNYFSDEMFWYCGKELVVAGDYVNCISKKSEVHSDAWQWNWDWLTDVKEIYGECLDVKRIVSVFRYLTDLPDGILPTTKKGDTK